MPTVRADAVYACTQCHISAQACAYLLPTRNQSPEQSRPIFTFHDERGIQSAELRLYKLTFTENPTMKRLPCVLLRLATLSLCGFLLSACTTSPDAPRSTSHIETYGEIDVGIGSHH